MVYVIIVVYIGSPFFDIFNILSFFLGNRFSAIRLSLSFPPLIFSFFSLFTFSIHTRTEKHMKWLNGNKFAPYVLMTAGLFLVLLSFQTFFNISNVNGTSSRSKSVTAYKGHPDAPVKACFVVLVRNSELDGIAHTIEQIEATFNNKFHYPYVFLNDDEFTPEFIARTSALTKSQTKYGKVDNQMWGYPKYINQTYAAECRAEMAKLNIPYADSESYRNMCRYVCVDKGRESSTC